MYSPASLIFPGPMRYRLKNNYNETITVLDDIQAKACDVFRMDPTNTTFQVVFVVPKTLLETSRSLDDYETIVAYRGMVWSCIYQITFKGNIYYPYPENEIYMADIERFASIYSSVTSLQLFSLPEPENHYIRWLRTNNDEWECQGLRVRLIVHKTTGMIHQIIKGKNKYPRFFSRKLKQFKPFIYTSKDLLNTDLEKLKNLNIISKTENGVRLCFCKVCITINRRRPIYIELPGNVLLIDKHKEDRHNQCAVAASSI